MVQAMLPMHENQDFKKAAKTLEDGIKVEKDANTKNHLIWVQTSLIYIHAANELRRMYSTISKTTVTQIFDLGIHKSKFTTQLGFLPIEGKKDFFEINKSFGRASALEMGLTKERVENITKITKFLETKNYELGAKDIPQEDPKDKKGIKK